MFSIALTSKLLSDWQQGGLLTLNIETVVDKENIKQKVIHQLLLHGITSEWVREKHEPAKQYRRRRQLIGTGTRPLSVIGDGGGGGCGGTKDVLISSFDIQPAKRSWLNGQQRTRSLREMYSPNVSKCIPQRPDGQSMA